MALFSWWPWRKREGEVVRVYKTDLVVPRAMVGTAERVDKLAANFTPETALEILLQQMCETLKPNYPRMTVRKLRERIVPADEVMSVHLRILVAAGLRKPEGGAEGKAESP
jgi:hypothetical protein